MGKAEASVEELVGMIERGELRLPEMQRRYVWRSTRVRDLLDSLYRGYPSGAILLWETDGAVPLQEFTEPRIGRRAHHQTAASRALQPPVWRAPSAASSRRASRPQGRRRQRQARRSRTTPPRES